MSGDPHAPTAPESTAAMLQAYTKYLPGLMQATNAQAVPTAQADLAAQQATAPGTQALNAQLFNMFAPQYAQTQNATNLAQIQGAGGQAALASQKLQQQIDPEYYQQRALMASKLSDLMSNPISGSESAAIERANNAGQLGAGTLGTSPSNLTTTQNAMNFGAAGRDRLTQALQAATQAIPNMRSGQDTFAQATGQGGTMGNISQNQSLQNQGAGSQAYGMGNNMLGQIGQVQQAGMNINANRRDSLDRAVQIGNSVTSGVGNVCCFIFMEAYNGQLPWYVRKSRDYYYEQDEDLSIGYRKMAKWLVPMMRKNRLVRWLVNTTMIKPLTKHARWKWTHEIPYPPEANFMRLFWFTIWGWI